MRWPCWRRWRWPQCCRAGVRRLPPSMRFRRSPSSCCFSCTARASRATRSSPAWSIGACTCWSWPVPICCSHCSESASRPCCLPRCCHPAWSLASCSSAPCPRPCSLRSHSRPLRAATSPRRSAVPRCPICSASSLPRCWCRCCCTRLLTAVPGPDRSARSCCNCSCHSSPATWSGPGSGAGSSAAAACSPIRIAARSC